MIWPFLSLGNLKILILQRWKSKFIIEDSKLTMYKAVSTKRLYGKQCYYCGRKADTIDHYYPKALGGTNAKSNFVPSCKKCNNLKRDLPPLIFIKNRKKLEAGEKINITAEQIRSDMENFYDSISISDEETREFAMNMPRIKDKWR